MSVPFSKEDWLRALAVEEAELLATPAERIEAVAEWFRQASQPVPVETEMPVRHADILPRIDEYPFAHIKNATPD